MKPFLIMEKIAPNPLYLPQFKTVFCTSRLYDTTASYHVKHAGIVLEYSDLGTFAFYLISSRSRSKNAAAGELSGRLSMNRQPKATRPSKPSIRTRQVSEARRLSRSQ